MVEIKTDLQTNFTEEDELAQESKFNRHWIIFRESQMERKKDYLYEKCLKFNNVWGLIYKTDYFIKLRMKILFNGKNLGVIDQIISNLIECRILEEKVIGEKYVIPESSKRWGSYRRVSERAGNKEIDPGTIYNLFTNIKQNNVGIKEKKINNNSGEAESWEKCVCPTNMS